MTLFMSLFFSRHVIEFFASGEQLVDVKDGGQDHLFLCPAFVERNAHSHNRIIHSGLN